MSNSVEARNNPQPSPEQHQRTLLQGNGYELITGRSNFDLAQKVATILSHSLDQPVTLFKDGEVNVHITHNLRRKHAIIIQSTAPPYVNDYYMELFMMVDAARRASADEITAVIPYFGYSRKDRKDEPRVAISASLMANLLTAAGVDRITTVDIHAEQSQGYVSIPWDNLYATGTLVEEISKKINVENLTLVSPDIGATKRTSKVAKAFGTTSLAVVYKERDVKPNSESQSLFFIGDVQGRDVLIVDDILNTGSTLADAAVMLKKQSAGRIFAAVTHGLFIDDALKRIEDSPIEKVFTTDTVAQRPEVIAHPKIQIISIARLIAVAVLRIHNGEGLSDLF